MDIFVFQIHTRRPMAFSHKIRDLMILAHEEVEIFWNFWFFVHFNRAGKIFFLNRFQKFQKFWKGMDVIRSFLAFKHQGTKLGYSAVPTLSENFGKTTNCDSHHPTVRRPRIFWHLLLSFRIVFLYLRAIWTSKMSKFEMRFDGKFPPAG